MKKLLSLSLIATTMVFGMQSRRMQKLHARLAAEPAQTTNARGLEKKIERLSKKITPTEQSTQRIKPAYFFHRINQSPNY